MLAFREIKPAMPKEHEPSYCQIFTHGEAFRAATNNAGKAPWLAVYLMNAVVANAKVGWSEASSC